MGFVENKLIKNYVSFFFRRFCLGLFEYCVDLIFLIVFIDFYLVFLLVDNFCLI